VAGDSRGAGQVFCLAGPGVGILRGLGASPLAPSRNVRSVPLHVSLAAAPPCSRWRGRCALRARTPAWPAGVLCPGVGPALVRCAHDGTRSAVRCGQRSVGWDAARPRRAGSSLPVLLTRSADSLQFFMLSCGCAAGWVLQTGGVLSYWRHRCAGLRPGGAGGAVTLFAGGVLVGSGCAAESFMVPGCADGSSRD
jgi:hypothetical protein